MEKCVLHHVQIKLYPTVEKLHLHSSYYKWLSVKYIQNIFIIETEQNGWQNYKLGGMCT